MLVGGRLQPRIAGIASDPGGSQHHSEVGLQTAAQSSIRGLNFPSPNVDRPLGITTRSAPVPFVEAKLAQKPEFAARASLRSKSTFLDLEDDY